MSDSSFSYIHMRRSHHVLHMEQWYKDKLPHDTIDAVVVDDDMDAQTVGHQPFGIVKNKTRKDAMWKDTHADKFFSGDKQWWEGVKDDTVLKHLEMNAHVGASLNATATTTTTTTVTAPAPREEIRSPVPEITTPEMLRNRGGNNMKSYQTPTARIMR